MLIYNTTYHVDNIAEEDFISFAKQIIIPRSTHTGALTHPRLSKILSQNDEPGHSFSLQFHVDSHKDLNQWLDDDGFNIHHLITKRFGNQVVGFVTLLEEIP